MRSNQYQLYWNSNVVGVWGVYVDALTRHRMHAICKEILENACLMEQLKQLRPTMVVVVVDCFCLNPCLRLVAHQLQVTAELVLPV